MTSNKTANVNKQRLHGLDFLRALMMSLGVVLHTSQMYMTLPMTDYYVDAQRSVSMDVILVYINTFRMPVFFLLSGFFTALLFYKRGYNDMLSNRYQRLLIPFVMFLPLLAICMSALRIVADTLMKSGQWGFDLSAVQHPDLLWNNTHNFWFLYYLLMFVGVCLLLIKTAEHWPGILRQVLVSCTAMPIYSPLVIGVVSLYFGTLGSTSFSGRVGASLSFVPNVIVFAYFFICFVIGWVLYQRIDDLKVLAKRCWVYFILANIALLCGLVCFAFQGEKGEVNYPILHAALSLFNGVSMTFFMLGFVGMFSRYFANYRPWVRYFSDSAYWVFILHSIPLVILGLLLNAWECAAEWKFLIVSLTTFLICMFTYHFWVRNTKIGEILNGRRYPLSPISKGHRLDHVNT